MYLVAFGSITILQRVCMCRVHSMFGLLASFISVNCATIWAAGRFMCTQVIVKSNGMD